jgi:glycine/D-amino acid oxidase-like deaminating enzyme
MKGDPRTHGLWERTAPPAPSTRPLQESITVDVMVIGAGYTGLSAALHLRELNVEVAVLEAEEIGFGGSGRNVGLVNAGLWLKPADVIKRMGQETGSRLVRQLSEAPNLVFNLIARHEIQCEAVRNGTLHCAVGESGYRDICLRASQWQGLDAPVDILDATATRDKVGSSAYTGSLLDRRAGTIQPLAYARGLASAAMSAGTRIFTKTPVSKLQEEKSKWRAHTTQGCVQAEWVIVATNAYSGVNWRNLRDELILLPYFNLATEPLTTSERRNILHEGQGIWDTRRILSSLRSDAAGRLIFGSVGALRDGGLEVHRNWAKRALVRLFPSLKDVGMEDEWYGQIGMTADAIPRFHQLARNVVSISGYNGRGIAPGTSFGRDLAHLVAGRITPADLSLPNSTPQKAPLRRTRELIYEFGSQVAHSIAARALRRRPYPG